MAEPLRPKPLPPTARPANTHWLWPVCLTLIAANVICGAVYVAVVWRVEVAKRLAQFEKPVWEAAYQAAHTPGASPIQTGCGVCIAAGSWRCSDVILEICRREQAEGWPVARQAQEPAFAIPAAAPLRVVQFTAVGGQE